jgi:hypothetical protein
MKNAVSGRDKSHIYWINNFSLRKVQICNECLENLPVHISFIFHEKGTKIGSEELSTLWPTYIQW